MYNSSQLFELDTIINNHYSDNLQTNISNILKSYGDQFIIKYNNVRLPAQLYKVYNSSYYGMKYPMEERCISFLPYDIIFADYSTSKKNNNCHINSIHKYNDLSGTQIVETLIQFLKLINVHKITLTDGSK